MARLRRNPALDPRGDALFASTRRAAVPHEFVLEALSAASPTTRTMFGCLAVYIDDKIVFVLRDKQRSAEDNGVWLATTKEHHESLRLDFPRLRSIGVLGGKVTGWQVLPADAPDFEEAALKACELVLARDPRIGKVPKSLRVLKARAKKAAKPLGLARQSRRQRT